MLRLSRDQSNNIGKFFSSGVLEELCRNKPEWYKTYIYAAYSTKEFYFFSCIIIANIKCTFWQMSILENRFSGKCPFRQMYIPASLRSRKCTFGIMYIRDNVHSAECLSGKYPIWKVFFGEINRIQKKHCFLWCHNVLWFWKPNFSILWPLHSFLHVFLSRHFLCDRLVKIWQNKEFFWLFFSLVQRMSIEQQINLKFLGKTPTEAQKLLQQIYGDDTMSRTRLFAWHRRFKEGREEVEDDHRSGRPSTSRTDENVEHGRQKARSDRRLTVTMIADELGMNSERVWRIIKEDLGMRKISAKVVPRLLNEGQK